jgi:hypothetical protein
VKEFKSDLGFDMEVYSVSLTPENDVIMLQSTAQKIRITVLYSKDPFVRSNKYKRVFFYSVSAA